jgi:hypothetical protein
MSRARHRLDRQACAAALAPLCLWAACQGGSPPARTERRDAVGPHIPPGYVLVGGSGATAFDAPPTQPVGAHGARLGGGFGFMVAAERTVGGRPYVQLRDGRWLAAGEVTRARPSAFTGVHLAAGQRLDFGWVVVPAAAVYASPSLEVGRTLGTRPRHARVLLAGACRDGACPLAAGWMRAADLAIPRQAPRPAEIGKTEAWLDVDLASQTLVAYVGDEPRFATLVSTGVAPEGSPLATPSGTFRIRSKHEVVRMDNLEHTGVEPYAYDVPLTQYFHEGKALHAALWHDQFGQPRSHGCINLAPGDAEWLFAFTSPTLGPGAQEVLASPGHPGTAVHIHGQVRRRE